MWTGCPQQGNLPRRALAYGIRLIMVGRAARVIRQSEEPIVQAGDTIEDGAHKSRSYAWRSIGGTRSSERRVVHDSGLRWTVS